MSRPDATVSAIRTSTLTTLVVAWCAVMALIPRPTFSQTLKNVGFIDVPGPKRQRFDYLTMDADDHYLLSAHLGPGILYVVDVRSNSVVKAIPGVPGITGVEYIPGLRKIYTSDWGEEKIGVVDLKSMRIASGPRFLRQYPRQKIAAAFVQGGANHFDNRMN